MPSLKPFFAACFFVLLALAASSAFAQSQALPKELSGKYHWVAGAYSNSFALEDIVASDDKSFAAKFTWWSRDPKCVIRGEGLTGHVTATGIAFKAKTKCNVPFSVELNRADKEWAGKAETTDGSAIVLELKAK